MGQNQRRDQSFQEREIPIHPSILRVFSSEKFSKSRSVGIRKGYNFLLKVYERAREHMFSWKGVSFLSKMVCERVRVWTSGRSLPVKNFVECPPPQVGGGGESALLVIRMLTSLGASY